MRSFEDIVDSHIDLLNINQLLFLVRIAVKGGSFMIELEGASRQLQISSCVTPLRQPDAMVVAAVGNFQWEDSA